MTTRPQVVLSDGVFLGDPVSKFSMSSGKAGTSASSIRRRPPDEYEQCHLHSSGKLTNHCQRDASSIQNASEASVLADEFGAEVADHLERGEDVSNISFTFATW